MLSIFARCNDHKTPCIVGKLQHFWHMGRLEAETGPPKSSQSATGSSEPMAWDYAIRGHAQQRPGEMNHVICIR